MSALAVCSTTHQLVMAQALARVLGQAPLRIAWIGNRPLAEHAGLLAPGAPPVEDLHGFKRVKLWTRGGREGLAEAAARLDRLAGAAGPPETLWIANDNSLFNRAALDAFGLCWDDVGLYEEGVGLYAGSRRYAEKSWANLRMALAGVPVRYRLFWRDFAHDRRIRRFACNHPDLLPRRGVEVVDLGKAYKSVLLDLAAAARSRGVAGAREGGGVDAVYISSTLSESGHVSFEEEARVLAELLGAIRRRLGIERVHVAFHPLDAERKRRVAEEIGFVPVARDVPGPFELQCLLREYRNVVSFRSSVLMNLPLLDLPGTRTWMLHGHGRTLRRLEPARIRTLFDQLMRRYGAPARLPLGS